MYITIICHTHIYIATVQGGFWSMITYLSMITAVRDIVTITDLVYANYKCNSVRFTSFYIIYPTKIYKQKKSANIEFRLGFHCKKFLLWAASI